MEQIIFAYSLPKETVTAMMMLYKSTDNDTNFFDTVAGVLQGDTLAHYLLILCQDYVLQMSIDLIKNGFTLKKRQEADISSRNYDRYRLLSLLEINQPKPNSYGIANSKQLEEWISM